MRPYSGDRRQKMDIERLRKEFSKLDSGVYSFPSNDHTAWRAHAAMDMIKLIIEELAKLVEEKK